MKIKILISITLALLLCSLPAFGAFGPRTTWEVQTGGSDINGGGFDPGITSPGTDESQSASGTAITVTLASSTTGTGSPAFTATTHGPGNFVYIASGSGCTVGWYEINSQSSGTATFSSAMGSTGNVCTGTIGGALLSPGLASVNAVTAANTIFIKNVGADGASVYSITSASAGIAGVFSTSHTNIMVQGYTSNRTLGNTDARPTIQINVASADIFGGGSLAHTVQGIVFDGNSQTASQLSAGSVAFIRCLFKGFVAATVSAGSQFINCESTGNSAVVFTGQVFYGDWAHGNTATGFAANSAFEIVNCISSGNTGSAVHGFSVTGNGTIANSGAYGNGGDGFRFTGTNFPIILINDGSESNGQTASTGYGYNYVGSYSAGRILINDAGYSNASGLTNLPASASIVGLITVTAGSVFTAPGSNDFSLNNIANRGALLRAAGYPATLASGATANYRDIGAAQHADPTGASTSAAAACAWVH